MGSTLGSFRTDVRRVLHDANAKYWSDSDLNAFINRAIKQRDRDSGQQRSLQTITLTAGQGTYPMNVAPFTTNTIDVLAIIVVFGNFRYPLSQVSYSELSSVFQPYQGYRNIPTGFAKYNATNVVLAPLPDQGYTTEWDTLIFTPDLVSDTDPDSLPYPWDDPVPFLAAHFARLEMQQYDEAQKYFEMYQQRLNYVQGGARGMQVSQPYGYNASGQR
jgi:hypothetical protein